MAGSLLEFIIFLGGVVVISLSGVLMPGPVLAITLAKSPKDKMAGLKVILGHGILEFPLMALIAVGFASALTEPQVKAGVSLIGGFALVIMGILMVRSVKAARKSKEEGIENDLGGDDDPGGDEPISDMNTEAVASGAEAKAFLHSPMVGGFLTSLNPYFFVWWATVGAALISSALAFGVIGLVTFAVVHWSCDLVWYTLIGILTHRSQGRWTPRVSDAVFALIGVFLVAFGGYFMLAIL